MGPWWNKEVTLVILQLFLDDEAKAIVLWVSESTA